MAPSLDESGDGAATERLRLAREVRIEQRYLVGLGAWAAAVGLVSWWLVPWLGYTLMVATVFGVILLAIAYGVDGFLPLGCAVFVSVALFGAAQKSLQSVYGTPRVQPSAALVTGYPQGVSGLYIGETPKRLYLARVTPCQERERKGVKGQLTGWLQRERQWRATPGSGIMFWVPASSVTALDIGPVQDLHQAMRNRKRMRFLLLENVTGRPMPLPPPTTEGRPCP
ncbi:hypothetical protein BH20ACT18_BH20ACT18_08870 [soil metagenome]